MSLLHSNELTVGAPRSQGCGTYNAAGELGCPGPARTAALPDAGYLVAPFLNASEVAALRALHRETTPKVPSDFYVSAFGTDVETKRRIFQGICEIVEDKVARLAPGYRILMASFATKRAGGKQGRLPLHQDYTMVNQDQHVGLNLWAPLSEVDARNGCLQVLEGSQNFGHISAIPPNPSPYENLRRDLETDYLAEVPMNCGSMCLFDARLLHATEANETPADRTAIFLSMVPAEATPTMYLWNENNTCKLESYAIDTEFLLHLTPNQYFPPEEVVGATFTGFVEYTPPTWSRADVHKILHLSEPAGDTSIVAPPARRLPTRPDQAPSASASSPAFWTFVRSKLAALIS